MNSSGEDQSAGQETVHAKTTGGLTPPIRTQSGLPANRAKLRDRGEHGSQVFETRRSGRGELAAARGLDETRVEAAVFPPAMSPAEESQTARTPPDFASMHEQLRQHRHLTLQVLWEEYGQANPEATVIRASANCTSVGGRS
jgi:hypothetical protein